MMESFDVISWESGNKFVDWNSSFDRFDFVVW